MKLCSTTFVAIVITVAELTNAAQKTAYYGGNFDDVSVCTSTANTFKQTFPPRIGTFIW